MPHKFYQNESRKDYGRIMPESFGMTGEEIKVGCLQRIAAATEAMAKNHDQLVRDRDYYKKLADSRADSLNHAERRIASLKGVITKLKKAGRTS